MSVTITVSEMPHKSHLDRYEAIQIDVSIIFNDQNQFKYVVNILGEIMKMYAIKGRSMHFWITWIYVVLYFS